MRIHIDKIPEEGLYLTLEKAQSDFSVLEKIGESGEAILEGPIRFDLTVLRAEELVTVTGTFSARVLLVCSRCLAEFSLELGGPFSMAYGPPESMMLHGRREVELTAEEIGWIPFEGQEIDLTDGLQEQIIMALPFKPLCREDCLGLCPVCGTDRNKKTCECQARPVDPRLVILARLKKRE